EEEMMDDELEIDWEDGSTWALSWCRDAGSYLAQRWYPEDEDDEDARSPLIEAPGPDVAMVEDIETLEAVVAGQAR
ncbi:MAG: hypothetical protein ACRDY5_09580, partial [Acidimicrobiales bacterium]